MDAVTAMVASLLMLSIMAALFSLTMLAVYCIVQAVKALPEVMRWNPKDTKSKSKSIPPCSSST